jgi:hypothetical protein
MSNYYQEEAISDELDDGSEDGGANEADEKWLKMATDAYRTSTDYMESSLKKQWEKNAAHFRSKHAPGSKYYSDSYKYRSKIFRPKTRSTTRRHEAAAAMAYFATPDATHISAEDEDNPQQVLAAAINKELLNYRLDRDVKWFQTLIAAYQETMVIGAVVSYQYWDYKEKTIEREQPVMDENGATILDQDGNQSMETVEQRVVVKDHLCIELRPIENIRIDPASDWSDPINSSPYMIDMIPMYIHEVKARMEDSGTKTGQDVWRSLSDGDIQSAMTHDYDSLRAEREGAQRQDSKAQMTGSGISEYTLIWVHRNFIKKDDQDYVFYTLGTQFMLTDPKPIEEVYYDSKRPYVMGNCIVEAHRNFPSALVELGENIQNETNEIANARIDNVKLAINKRFYIRRGANVDFGNLMRSAPGSGILMDDIQGDVREEKMTDVTSSSYQEQDRLNLDYDDVTGAFSPSTIQSNRKMNETVGGMEMLSADSNVMSEYQLRVFNETWVEPVLDQCLKLIQRYETDTNVMNIAGQRAGSAAKGVQQVDWRMLQGPMVLKVNVGFGATNPMKRIENLAMGLRTIGEFMPQMLQGLDGVEVISEVFGAIGDGDGSRFFKALKEDEAPDPMITKLQQEVQQLQQMLQTKQIEQQGKVEVETIRQQGNSQREQMKLEAQQQIETMKAKLTYIDKQLMAETNAIKREELYLQRDALIFNQRTKEIELLQIERNSMAGVLNRDDYGMMPGASG